MRNQYIIISLLLNIAIFSYGQSKDQNYIRTRTYISSTDTLKYMDQIQYFDGLGRPNQIVQVGITPSKGDLITHQEYDEFGRESNTWLPSVSKSNNGAFVNFEAFKAISNSTYNNTSYNTEADTNPFSKPIYEASPLNRILEQYGPGKKWHGNYDNTSGHAVRTANKTNISGDKTLNCIWYTAGTDNKSPILKINSVNNYKTGELYVTELKDENGNISYEFRDKLGQVLLTRQINSGENYDTYYVYNDFGNLCFVLPPLTAGKTDITTLNLYAYQYKYDERNRCFWKKLPGADPIYYAYDKADQLIFTQDGEQRKDNKNEWTFSIPDVFGRVALTGICTDTISIAEKVVKATYIVTGGYEGYNVLVDATKTDLPKTHSLLSVNYYDNYNFLNKNGFPNFQYLDNKEKDGYNKAYGTHSGEQVRNKGLLTGTITMTLGNESKKLHAVMYYDDKGRVVQTRSTNHMKGTDDSFTAYNFAGQPTRMQTIQKVTLNDGQTKETIEVYTYFYDHAGRLVETRHKLNNSNHVMATVNNYDELGRLSSTNCNIYQQNVNP